MDEVLAQLRTLRLVQTSEGEDKYRVEVTLEGENLAHHAFTTSLDFQLLSRQGEEARWYLKGYQQDEDLRWYLEDYLQYPFEPAPQIANRIEGSIVRIGENLFRSLFHASEEAQRFWTTLQKDLENTRVEISTDVQGETAIPWELLRDPETEIPLVLSSCAFVRMNSSVVPGLSFSPSSGPVRILLVICRPSRGDDVPFRSIAGQLVESLKKRGGFQLDVLRPPTFDHLQQRLQDALAKGQPYQIVHFDGHGVYEDVMATEMNQPAKKRRGYLVFENSEGDEELIHGAALGEVLRKAHTPLVVLNACRSAYAEAPAGPTKSPVNNRTAAFGSLAQEVLAAGVLGVVAMRYNIYVVTAAQFVTNLYTALLRGLPLGEAITLCRKNLADHPMRQIAYEPRLLQDWMVPIVYEATPIQLLSRLTSVEETSGAIGDADSGSPQETSDLKLPMPPSVGFFGRDETLLALDRAFDRHPVILLHGYAGSGKTAAAVEFARWYKSTGGMEGPVLFTSFEQPKLLRQVLDQLGYVFGDALERAGIPWLALDDTERRKVALLLLQQIPVLWIWDNIESVAGFPSGGQLELSKTERQELTEFIQALPATRAKLLLTSRRDEDDWLGMLPQRVNLPPMHMFECVQLARAVVEKHRQQWNGVTNWWSLLQFTQGNPLTIIVVVGQVLQNGLKTRQEIETFIDELRSGDVELEDDAGQGRSHSLSASLKYGFEHAFSESERKQLALLYFFQHFIDVDVLRTMGNPDAPWCLTEVKNITPESGILLLDRAAEIGLLNSLGNGYYSIHPVLPWYFKRLFEQYYTTVEGEHALIRAARAYVSAVSGFGEIYHNRFYQEGDNTSIANLSAEEDNLLYAHKLALKYDWSLLVIASMAGLRILYNRTGRQGEWESLVMEVLPKFVDPKSGDPLPGRIYEWSMVTEFYVKRLMEMRQWEEAEYWQRKRISVDLNQRNVNSLLTKRLGELSLDQRLDIRDLAVSVEDLATILRDQQRPDCIETYQNAIQLYQFVEDRNGEAIAVFNLGRAYMEVSSIYNLKEAEQWLRQSLELRNEQDYLGQALCLGQLGSVELTRIKDMQAQQVKLAHPIDANQQDEEERKRSVEKAIQYYEQALIRLPANALDEQAIVHNGLASAYGMAGDYNRSFQHYLKSIYYDEVSGNLYRAAGTRLNMGAALMAMGSFTDALLYAQSALQTFEAYGETAEAEIQRARVLIKIIQQFQQRLKHE